MSIIDLTGSVIVLTRDDASVHAVAGKRVGSDDDAVSWVDPKVVVREVSTTLSPGGPGNGRIAKQRGLYLFRCYGQTRIQAQELARRVASAWNQSGIRLGSSGLWLRQAWVDVIQGPINDTRRTTKPYSDVTVDVLAETRPMA